MIPDFYNWIKICKTFPIGNKWNQRISCYPVDSMGFLHNTERAMNRLPSLPVVLLLLSCSGGDKGGDDRQFGSLSASFGSRTSGSNSSDAVVVEPSDDAILGKDIDGGAIDALGKSQVPIDSQGAGKGAEVGKGGTQPETKPVTPPAKTPDLPDDLKPSWQSAIPSGTRALQAPAMIFVR
jgi:hypothetical protein